MNRTINKTVKKIKSNSGETLTETLVSVLIVALASTVLALMISTSAKLNNSAKEYDNNVDKAVSALTSASEGTEKKMKLTLGKDDFEIPVIMYKDNGILTSYELSTGTGTGTVNPEAGDAK